MNPIILPPDLGKQLDRLDSSALLRQIDKEKENSEFQPVKLRLKSDLVSYPARAEGLVNIDMSLNKKKKKTKKSKLLRSRFELGSSNPIPLGETFSISCLTVTLRARAYVKHGSNLVWYPS